MLVAIGIHHPKGKKEESVLRDAMHRFGEAQKKHVGLIMVHLLKDEKSGVLIGLALWDTKEHFMQAQEGMARRLRESTSNFWRALRTNYTSPNPSLN
jgi:hypothetical protein